MLKLAIAGVGGRMGSRILTLASSDKEIESVAVFESPSHNLAGRMIPFRSSEIKVLDNCRGAFALSDVLIDFTSPSATIDNLEVALSLKKPIVIGTTGFNDVELKKISSASAEIPIVFSPNMSIGVNLLFRLVELTTNILSKSGSIYDMEIVELHHNLKKDSPSGTAAKIASIISSVTGGKVLCGRTEGITGPRKQNEIGIHAVRAGDIVGEHTVYFVGGGERIELTHRAHSRDCFASGAITAAKWIVKNKKSAGLYSMAEVLGI